MFRINGVSALFTLLLIFSAQGASARGGCAAFGAPDWTAPARAGGVEKAWPLARPDVAAWGQGRARILKAGGDLQLEVSYPSGSINPGNPRAPEGGLGFYDHLGVGDGLAGCLSYEVRFQEGFQFAKGGKLPGLGGGENVSGCTRHRKSGFSTRYMWSRHGDGFIYAYLADRRNECGDGIWGDQGAQIKFKPGRWHRLEQLVVLNTPGKRDGVLKVWFDGRLMIDKNRVRYRDAHNVRIDGLMFSTFFGGHSRGNASPRDQKTWFRHFEYRALGRRSASLEKSPDNPRR